MPNYATEVTILRSNQNLKKCTFTKKLSEKKIQMKTRGPIFLRESGPRLKKALFYFFLMNLSATAWLAR